ncbi:SpaA isopeptide-forming pilin-related protein [Bacillus sp. FSL R10-2789]
MRKSLSQKVKKICSSFIIILLVCMNFLIHLPYKAEAATTELKGLGDTSYYNAIIFGDHSATSADIEGAMAVQKNMNASSYTVVAAATGANNLAGATWKDEGYPSLLLGGQFTKAGAGQVIIQDGTVAMTKDGDPEGAMKSSYDRISYKEQAEIDAKFKEFRKDVDGVIGNASQLHTDKPKPNMSFGIGEDVNNPNIYVSSGLTGKKTFDVKDVYLPNVNNKDFIVIYSDAEEVNFGSGAILYDTKNTGMATDLINTSQAYDPNSPFTELASKVIWAFPNATKISTKGYGVVGSVFAPNAVVETKGGSINGQAYVGGLHQRDGFEVHNFKFNWPKWKNPSVEKGNLQIKKVDANDENIVLKDAKFDVIDKDNNVVATVTTNEKGIAEVKDLPLGDYFVKEISAPEGYIKVDTPVKVTINGTNVIEIVMKNTKKVENGQFKLLKKDSESGQLLPGAKFDVIDKDGNVVETIITDGKGAALSKQLPVGTYTLKEVEAPKGYELSSSSVRVDVAANKTVTVDVLNKKIAEKATGQFEIVKVDANDKTKLLSDAEFEVYKDGEKIDTLRTDKTGKVISKKLEPGKYTLKETKAPKGYKLLKEEIEVVVEANKVVQVQVENAKELGSLQVIKKDAESGKVLEGAEFRLKNENGQVVGEAKTTNKDGVVTFENLVPGKYTLEETKAPEGYKAVELKVEVNVVANEVVKQEVMNEKVLGQFEIVKVDANDKTKLLSDAEFTVYKDGKKVAELKTDESGKAMLPKLPLGEYTVKETKAPAGYKISNKEWKVTIQNEKEVVKVEAENEKLLGSLQIIKTDDKDQAERLAGAVFTLKDAKGNVVKEKITTDKSGTVKVEGLVPGEYTLEETKAPEGYELTKQVIHVTVNGEKVVDVKVTNSKSLGQFEIVKVDANDKTKLLSDAEFEVYKDGKKVEMLQTDKTGKVISGKLEPGKYTLKETKAPKGYKLLKEEIEVVVEANKVVQVQVENAKELGSLQVIKKDAESGKVLEGAEFRLKNENGQVVGAAKTTNKDGVVTFENLVPGKYTLEETKAPEGYKAVEVTVKVNVVANEVAKQEVLNEKVKEKITGQVEITKIDANDTDKKLEGAVFEILKDGIKIDTLTSDKNGKATSKKLEPGDYVLKEVQAPEGYNLSDKGIEFTISNEKVEVIKLQITNEKETGKGPEKPGGETETPGGETETPGGETETPGGETETPGGETETPGGETETPGGETETPGGETETPGGETETPGGETETPGGETETPGGETETPGGETETPGGETETPGGGTETPGGEIEKPGGETETPGGETETPGGETETPGGETETPGGETEKPGGEIETPGGETETPGGETETPGGETETPGGETEKPGGETETPGGETETPGGETEKPGGETETPGGETEKPGEGAEKPGGETGTPGEGIEKPGEGTESPGEEVEKPNLPEKEQGGSNNQKLPATGHNTDYLPFIGVILVLLGIRLRFMIKNS